MRLLEFFSSQSLKRLKDGDASPAVKEQKQFKTSARNKTPKNNVNIFFYKVKKRVDIKDMYFKFVSLKKP